MCKDQCSTRIENERIKQENEQLKSENAKLKASLNQTSKTLLTSIIHKHSIK